MRSNNLNTKTLYKYYFTLQLRRLHRWLEELGVSPVIFYVLVVPVFIILSQLLFTRTELAPYIYAAIAVMFGGKLIDNNRIQNLALIFKNTDILTIRFLEQTMVFLPFILFMLYKRCYLFSITLFAISILFSFVNNRFGSSKVVPTPFKRMPFEFSVGIRQSVPVLLGVCLLLAKAIQVDNFYLALFSLGVLFLIFFSYYFYPEKKYFVWIFSKTINEFLKQKLLFGLCAGFVLTMPICGILFCFYPERWILICSLELVGLLILLSVILVKYAAFPKEMNLPQAILFTLSLIFPPLLLLSIPLFYVQARRKLQLILR